MSAQRPVHQDDELEVSSMATTEAIDGASSDNTVNGDDAVDNIRAYLEAQLRTAVRLVGRAPGASHDGWIFRSADNPRTKVLVRIEPDDGPFLTYDGASEAALLRELGARGLPVPEVIAVVGREICGSRFLVLN